MSKLSTKLGDITFRAAFFIFIFTYEAAKCICFCIKHAGRVVFAILPAWVFFVKKVFVCRRLCRRNTCLLYTLRIPLVGRKYIVGFALPIILWQLMKRIASCICKKSDVSIRTHPIFLRLKR